MNPAAYLGQQIDLDGFPAYQRFQCLDWARKWQQVEGGPQDMPTPFSGGAKDVWTYHDTGFYEAYSSGVPQQGDIIIWNGNYGGGYGHIAVVESADAGSFVSLDQNWSGPYVSRERHSYDGVLGWLRKRGTAVADQTAEIQARIAQYTQLQREQEQVLGALYRDRLAGVILSYRAYLNREPESIEVVQAWLNANPDKTIAEISDAIKAYAGKNGEQSGYPFTGAAQIPPDLQSVINKYSKK